VALVLKNEELNDIVEKQFKGHAHLFAVVASNIENLSRNGYKLRKLTIQSSWVVLV
jgi:hypothetical protein